MKLIPVDSVCISLKVDQCLTTLSVDHDSANPWLMALFMPSSVNIISLFMSCLGKEKSVAFLVVIFELVFLLLVSYLAQFGTTPQVT